MNKTIILILVLILIVPLVYSLENCKGTMFQQDIPCLLLLPVNQSVTPCNTLTTKVYNNGSTLLYTQTMAIYSPFKCNNTFNQTDFGTYNGQYGTGDTFTLVVEEDRFQQYYLYVAAFIILLSLIGLGFWKHDGTFMTIAGMFAMIIGINIFVNGFPNLTNTFLRNGVTLIMWGIGAYLVMLPGMEFFENWGDS